MNATQESRNKFCKLEWQRKYRAEFKQAHGYSSRANYGCGGNREIVLQRDGRKCVQCGLSEAQHLVNYGRPITIDHKDRNRANNHIDNLQTLCLECHGRKDILPKLKERKLEPVKNEIMDMRKSGKTYQSIADSLGFSIGAVHRWVQKWS